MYLGIPTKSPLRLMKPKKLIHNQLITKHLVISELSQDDSHFICEICNSPGWIKYIGDRNIKNEDDAYKMLQERYLPAYNDTGFGMYKVSLRENKKTIGMCGFMQRDYLDYPDLGFAILPGYNRKGYTFEAATKLMDLINDSWGVKRLYGVTSYGNNNSQYLLNKLGFTLDNEIKIPDSTIVLFRHDFI
jgi:RimJ/RimL family protein N-acetyltransferase